MSSLDELLCAALGVVDDAQELPRLDLMSDAECAATLGVTEAQLRELERMGWRRWDGRFDMPEPLGTQSEVARELGVTDRQIRNLEERGLPVVGTRKLKRYPLALADEWYVVWRSRAAAWRGTGVRTDHLDPRAARRAYDAALPLVLAYSRVKHHDGRLDPGEVIPITPELLSRARDMLGRWAKPPLYDEIMG